MSDKSAFFLFVVGLLMTLGGVGGVETSVDNLALVQATLVAVVGLAVMGCGVLAIKVNSIG